MTCSHTIIINYHKNIIGTYWIGTKYHIKLIILFILHIIKVPIIISYLLVAVKINTSNSMYLIKRMCNNEDVLKLFLNLSITNQLIDFIHIINYHVQSLCIVFPVKTLVNNLIKYADQNVLIVGM